MTELLSGVEAPSDAELISRVRGGDVTAYGELFARHVEAARRLGRQLVRGPDVDDLVSDAFAKTLTVLQRGGGPDVAFRAYLLTSVRRLHVDRIRAAKKVTPADDMTVFDDGEPFRDTAVAEFENGAAAKAFASLPERWQLVLWHLEVEGQKPADIAPLLGMSANSVSALAYRAREGLRQAFLTMHLADSATDQCRWVNQHLGAYVRKGLSKRDTAKVEAHLDECRRCTAMYLELTEVNSNLSALIAPLVLGAAAAGYLGSAGGVGATGLTGFLGRVRDTFAGRSGSGSGGAGGTGSAGGAGLGTGGMVAAGGVAAAGIAAVVTAALVLGGASKEVITEADQPVGTPPVAAAPGEPGADTGVDPAEEPAAETVDEADDSGDQATSASDVPLAGEAPADEPLTDDTGTTANPPADTPPADAPPADTPPADTPGTTDPGTTDPGTTDPGTTDPGTTDPGTTDPGTTDPGTTDPGTTDPPPAEPTPAEPTPTELSLTATPSIDGAHNLVFALEAPADGALPPTVDVELTSDPSGLVFGDAPGCTTAGTVASCVVTPPLLAAGGSGLRAVAGTTSHVVSIPVRVPEGRDGPFAVSVALTLPEGYVLAGGTTRFDFDFTPTPADPGGDPGDPTGPPDPPTDPPTDPADPPTDPTDPPTDPTDPTDPGGDGDEDGDPADPVSISFTAPTGDGPKYDVTVTVENLPAGAQPRFDLAGADHAKILDSRAQGAGRYVVTVQMPPGQGVEQVTLVVTVPTEDGPVTASASFTVGREAQAGGNGKG